jgi:hypothetical protein
VQLFAVPKNCKCIRPDPVAGWFDNGQRNGRGNGCVYSVAAAHQHRKPCLGSQRLRGCDQVVCGNGGSPGWVMVVGTQVHVIASGLRGTMMSYEGDTLAVCEVSGEPVSGARFPVIEFFEIW